MRGVYRLTKTQHAVYEYLSWVNIIDTWRGGRGRFAEHGSRWDGQDVTESRVVEVDDGPDEVLDDGLSERHEDELEEAKETSSSADTVIFRGPYTDEEELAMSQFVQAMKDRDGEVKYPHWAEFAQVVSTDVHCIHLVSASH